LSSSGAQTAPIKVGDCIDVRAAGNEELVPSLESGLQVRKNAGDQDSHIRLSGAMVYQNVQVGRSSHADVRSTVLAGIPTLTECAGRFAQTGGHVLVGKGSAHARCEEDLHVVVRDACVMGFPKDGLKDMRKRGWRGQRFNQNGYPTVWMSLQEFPQRWPRIRLREGFGYPVDPVRRR
jgi:hypothetical protein